MEILASKDNWGLATEDQRDFHRQATRNFRTHRQATDHGSKKALDPPRNSSESKIVKNFNKASLDRMLSFAQALPPRSTTAQEKRSRLRLGTLFSAWMAGTSDSRLC
ncbi:hypothetical protein PGT21_015126 [Puccinia graminis f. sp. tritici]|uniref:Uncharacterized protein n=1 Tax=Puccinia graminis f. sp. tritici TaxID=56615 RepID=A0A5B0LL28_PUCGR|nr:hypothetical protein PGT21_015126 [Puccinia graminis f. sp. tritici]